MVTTYKENRILPVAIILACLVLYYNLVDTSLPRFGGVKASTNITAQSSTAGSTSSRQNQPSQSDSREKLKNDDLLLIMKTGGTSTYNRLLSHLITSLSPERISPGNTVIYSDYVETIGNFTTIDILTNLTEATKSHPDFDVYRAVPQYFSNNVYIESANIEGDHPGPVGGWVVDKYKFLPLMDHAGRNWPNARWYVFMEDDAYIFLPNVLEYLSSFDSTAPHYLGSYAFLSNTTFAHGGSGFALSRGAWEVSFGKNPRLVDDYSEYTRQHGCGDQILGRALNDYGVHFGENGEGKFTWGFNSIVHWKFGFHKENWCVPIFSWHKAHSRDVARYYELEKSWGYETPLLYGDFFKKIIAPDLADRREWWDNLSAQFEITSGNAQSPPAPKSRYNAGIWADAWKSLDGCEKACKSWDKCMQWSYKDDICRMDDRLYMGSGFAPGMYQRKTGLLITSGWILDRIPTWTCK